MKYTFFLLFFILSFNLFAQSEKCNKLDSLLDSCLLPDTSESNQWIDALLDIGRNIELPNQVWKLVGTGFEGVFFLNNEDMILFLLATDDCLKCNLRTKIVYLSFKIAKNE